jgi:hypothetical protein
MASHDNCTEVRLTRHHQLAIIRPTEAAFRPSGEDVTMIIHPAPDSSDRTHPNPELLREGWAGVAGLSGNDSRGRRGDRRSAAADRHAVHTPYFRQNFLVTWRVAGSAISVRNPLRNASSICEDARRVLMAF